MLFVLKLLLAFFSLFFFLRLLLLKQVLGLGVLVFDPILTNFEARLVFCLFVILISFNAERGECHFGYPVTSQDIIDASECLILYLIVVIVVLFYKISML